MASLQKASLCTGLCISGSQLWRRIGQKDTESLEPFMVLPPTVQVQNFEYLQLNTVFKDIVVETLYEQNIILLDPC